MDLFQQSAREIAVDQLHSATAIYTREPIVDELLDALDWPNGLQRLVDPSAGDGAFMGRALERLLLAQPGIDDARLSHVLEGWEIHPFAASEAQARLAGILTRHGRTRTNAQAMAQRMVHVGDFLLEGPQTPTFDSVACNPPYLRMAHVPELIRDDYERVLPLHAQADLLHSFLDRLTQVLNPGGAIAAVTSDRWCSSENASKLRAVIGEKLGIAHVERLDCDSAFYRPKLRRKGSPPRVHPIAIVLKHAAECQVALTSAPFFPGSEIVETSGPVLGDVATVRIAPWLGTPGIFVLDQALCEGFPAEELVPAIDTDDIVKGVLQPPKRYALRTRKDREPSPKVLAHLDAHLHTMCERGRRPVRWLPPESFEKFDLTREHLLIPRIAKTLKPIRVPAGQLPVNHNLSVVDTGSWSLDQIEELLSSDRAKAWVEARAPRLENGYYSITTRFLRSLPVSPEN